MAFYGAGLTQIALNEVERWAEEADQLDPEGAAYDRVVTLLKDLLENDGKLAA